MAKTMRGIAFRQLDTLLNVGAVGGLTDAQLLELFTTGRDETAEVAFTVLVDRHGPMVLRVCQAVLRDSHDAQDAFQATFLVLVKKARGLWVRESLGPWLHQVAHRIASGMKLAKARRRRHEKQAAALSADLAADSNPDDLGEVLHREVSRLPERYRAAVVLCLLEGLTPEQAARQLGWPAGTVHSRLARGRERLRGRLTHQGLAPSIVGLGSLPAAELSATVPPALVAATGHAASRVIAGEMMDEIVSISVATLTKGALRTKMMTKLMIAAGATLALGVAITGAGTLGYIGPRRDDASSPPGQQKVQGEPSPESAPVSARAQEAPADTVAIQPGNSGLVDGLLARATAVVSGRLGYRVSDNNGLEADREFVLSGTSWRVDDRVSHVERINFRGEFAEEVASDVSTRWFGEDKSYPGEGGVGSGAETSSSVLCGIALVSRDRRLHSAS